MRASLSAHLPALAALLDAQAGRYRELNGARSFGDYLRRERSREDEELLTEPVLQDLLERVLGFPRDGWFAQLGRARLEDGELRFSHARRLTARVEGPPARLALLHEAVAAKPRLLPDELGAVRLPADLAAFDELRARREGEIETLLEQGRTLVEAVERLVCALYDVPERLTELVVESAVSRAGTVAADDDSSG